MNTLLQAPSESRGQQVWAPLIPANLNVTSYCWTWPCKLNKFQISSSTGRLSVIAVKKESNLLANGRSALCTLSHLQKLKSLQQADYLTAAEETSPFPAKWMTSKDRGMPNSVACIYSEAHLRTCEGTSPTLASHSTGQRRAMDTTYR